MNITIKTIPHKLQRYNTVGDWWFNTQGNLEVRVSKMNDWKYEYLVADHEVREALLCKDRGITQKKVDRFDIEYEKKRKEGDFSEPGNSKKAPYYKEHQFATKVEKMTAKELKVNWKKYDKTVNDL